LSIILGKDYFVPGFDKNIIGAKKEADLKFDLVIQKIIIKKILLEKRFL
jgi:FKBP-type peptidyl-prolyl cis-trans isomerase (trigger factor)